MRAEKVFFHDDDCGVVLTPDGWCPICRFSPDMQSLGLMYRCPTHRVELHVGMTCPVCKVKFEKPE